MVDGKRKDYCNYLLHASLLHEELVGWQGQVPHHQGGHLVGCPLHCLGAPGGSPSQQEVAGEWQEKLH